MCFLCCCFMSDLVPLSWRLGDLVGLVINIRGWLDFRLIFGSFSFGSSLASALFHPCFPQNTRASFRDVGAMYLLRNKDKSLCPDAPEFRRSIASAALEGVARNAPVGTRSPKTEVD